MSPYPNQEAKALKTLLERLKERKPLVAEGATGTMLLAMGLKPGECPESLNLTRPEWPEDVARQYFEAGADIIHANTFGASLLKLAMYGLQDRTEEINRNGVQAVRKVVGDRAYVSASLGPCGRLLKPYGDTDAKAVYDSFRRQVAALTEAGVDAISFETMTDLNEAKLGIQAAKDLAPALPVMATMTFDATPRGFFTIMGTNIEKAAAGLQAAGADVIGSNCGNGTLNMIEIARQFRECSSLPLLIQPNAGLPEIRDGVPVYSEAPRFMVERAKELVALGVSIIGGCCGTTPEYTRGLRKMVGMT
jgi:5-methyltetrahydrofolate--homocysteine methyltransferase